MISGFFRDDAGFINAHIVSEKMDIDEAIEFLSAHLPPSFFT